MCSDFKQRHKGLVLKDLLWRAALETKVVDFNGEMEKLRTTDSAAYDWVKKKVGNSEPTSDTSARTFSPQIAGAYEPLLTMPRARPNVSGSPLVAPRRMSSDAIGDNSLGVGAGHMKEVESAMQNKESKDARFMPRRSRTEDKRPKERREVAVVGIEPLVQFGPSDGKHLQNPHHDALVVTATIANYDVKRMFIDSGSLGLPMENTSNIRIAAAFDRRVLNRELQMRDLLLQRADILKPVGNLRPKWEDPFKIVQVHSRGAYMIEDMDGRRFSRP
ncbi:hypothetical protein BUALT_Bualt01G0164000 [Buddleja alternifolia]|uniref:Uncharacterized protein n=1 Tax=Buddleja alternifolia TaxID=168488 RepID=A0AAV6Y8Q4_9LAMI|nr:hypothetical protein BUALT_Bualt01G0164000 [Buddleja alternifolia]